MGLNDRVPAAAGVLIEPCTCGATSKGISWTDRCMSRATARLAVSTVVVLLVALAALTGSAVAEEGSSLEVEVSASGPGGGGGGSMDCTGDPVGEHTCDKEGAMTAGPVSGTYEGYNDGNTAGGPYAFGDDFAFVVFGQEVGIDADCAFEREPPSSDTCTGGPTGS